jgi:1-acyl-sn-glycerol-3-phosphate acyltransferase
VEQIVFEGDAYRTKPHPVSFLSRALPSLPFYVRLVSLVMRASRKANQGRYDTREWCGSSLETLRALEQAGVSIEVTGFNRLRTLDGPCVLIGNHMSTLETFVLPVLIASFKEATFVVKQSLVDYPVFKHVMRSRNPITVGRSNPRDDLKAVLEGGAERLKAGSSIIIFPQTTRTAVFDPDQFNTIGIKLAKKAGVPIVPIALKTDAWNNGTYLKDFGRIDPRKKVYFAFGDPLWIKDRGNEEHQRIIEFITGKLREWDKGDSQSIRSIV